MQFDSKTMALHPNSCRKQRIMSISQTLWKISLDLSFRDISSCSNNLNPTSSMMRIYSKAVSNVSPLICQPKLRVHRGLFHTRAMWWPLSLQDSGPQILTNLARFMIGCYWHLLTLLTRGYLHLGQLPWLVQQLHREHLNHQINSSIRTRL